MPRQTQRYGWIPSLPDQRDFRFSVAEPHIATALPATLPDSVDLRSLCPPIYNQGQLGSCTANAIAGALAFDRMKQQLTPLFTPSRLFIYYNERVIEQTVNCDGGAMLRDGMKAIASLGVCPEDTWPYKIDEFATQPSLESYQQGEEHRAIVYQAVNQDLNEMKSCLAAGYPFVLGFTVYESFESDTVAQTGIVPMPQPTEKVLGGHAVVAVGYDEATKTFICRNSWGTSWGLQGYFMMPYDYLLNTDLSSDFWTIRVTL